MQSDMDVLEAIHGRLDEYALSSLPGSDGAILCSDLARTSLLHSDLEIFSKFDATNLVPGPQDILHINAFVLEKNIELSSLALQMANIDSAIRKLAAIRVRLEQDSAYVRQSLLAHQALTSAARRVPPEVLGEVFYHCLSKTPYITPKDVESPLVLTQVCRRWRAVAISTPRLWSSLSIYLQKAVHEPYRRGCETWFTRAKGVPLTVRVLNDLNMVSLDPTPVPSVVHWLRPLIVLCGDLWWHGPTLPTLFVLETGTGTDIPIERLQITSNRDIPSIHFPGPARQLRSASMQCLNYDLQSLDRIRLPWDRLVELHMHFALFSSTLFVELLRRCGHLRRLVASCLCADEDQLGVLRALSPGSVTHPSLCHIEIKVIRAGLDIIFDALTLPALEQLDVCFCYSERDAWPHAQFMKMMERSQCALRRLTVRSNKTAVPYFKEYMEMIPGLATYTSLSDPIL